MNKETVIALAREAGKHQWPLEPDFLERFAELIEAHLKAQGYRQCAKGQKTSQFCGMLEQAVKAEREACAKACEGRIGGAVQSNEWWAGFKEAMKQCAAAIRSRT